MLPEFNVWYNLYCLDSPAGIVEFPPQPAAVTSPQPAIVNQPSTGGATSAEIEKYQELCRNFRINHIRLRGTTGAGPPLMNPNAPPFSAPLHPGKNAIPL